MMKKIILIATLFLSMNTYALTQRIEILGMVCAFCAQGIEKSFISDENVKDVFVNLKEYFMINLQRFKNRKAIITGAA